MTFKIALKLGLIFAVSACANANFGGKTDRHSEAPAPAKIEPVPTPAASPEPAPVPIATPKPPAPPMPPDLPPACENTIATTGVFDASTGFTFKLLTSQQSYDDGIAACRTMLASGRLIFAGQNLPDDVLACKQALGTLWLRPDDRTDAIALWSPAVAGNDDRSAKHWIICYGQGPV